MTWQFYLRYLQMRNENIWPYEDFYRNSVAAIFRRAPNWKRTTMSNWGLEKYFNNVDTNTNKVTIIE